MGEVYLAKDTKLKRQVAIKFLPDHLTKDKENVERFEREAEAAAALNHPNIVTIHDVIEEDDQTCIVMEYIEGRSLRDVINEYNLGIDKIIDMIQQLSDGLSRAHKAGIVHRDIKPENIIIDQDDRIKILDFGLAKLKGVSKLTKETSTLGTIHYMSPEQIIGKDIDQRSDIWSLGVVIYELLTGEKPFEGQYEQAVSYAIVNDSPRWELVPNENKKYGLQNIIYKCLEKNPDKRYQSVTDLIVELKKSEESSSKFKLVLGRNIVHYSIRVLTENLKSTKNKIYLFISVLILLLVFYIIYQKPYSSNSIHIAILPINYTGENPEERKFCDGLFEYLTGQIGMLKRYQKTFSVVPSSEIRGENVISVKQARQLFNINLAIEMTVNFFNNYVQLTVNIIDADELRLVNSATLQDTSKSKINLQTEIALEIAGLLNLEDEKLNQSILGRTTLQPNTFENYLKGKNFLQDYESIDNINKALEYFYLSANYDTNYALAYVGLAEAYYRKYEYEKKTQYADSSTKYSYKAIRLNNTLAESHIILGMIHSLKGLYDEAISDFKNAINIDITNHIAYRELARVYSRMNKPDLAVLTSKRAIQLNPEYWANYNYLGVHYYQIGDYEAALKQFKKVIELRPRNVKGYNNVGGTYFLLGKIDSSKIALNKSIEIEPNLNGYYQLGVYYFYQKQYSEAAEMFLAATEFSGEDYPLWGNLANSYFWSGEKEKAIKYYKMAIKFCEPLLEVNPKNTYVIADLAGYNVAVGNKNEAIKLLNKAIRYGNLEPSAMFTIGAIFETLGDREKALEWIKNAVNSGYSLSEIELSPDLIELRKDERYINFVASKSGKM
jgi:serine/threonine-protein kinase